MGPLVFKWRHSKAHLDKCANTPIPKIGCEVIMLFEQTAHNFDAKKRRL